MRDRVLALRWAKKLLSSKSFVVLTDKESFIAVDGLRPDSLKDLLILQAQHASIAAFKEDLERLLTDHEKRMKEIGGRVGITRSKSSAKTTGKNKKVQPKRKSSKRV